MKKLVVIVFSVLLLAASMFGVGAPVFIGSTTDYWTNSGANLILVRSNRTELIIDRVTGQFLIFGGQLSVSTGAVSQLTVSQGVGSYISTATRTGGALTNITLDANGPQIVHADGSTNVNIVAMMNWVAGLQRPVTLMITNRTATPRTVSLGATTNNFIVMGSLTAPWSVTNALWIAMENLGSSNVVCAAQYMANPTN